MNFCIEHKIGTIVLGRNKNWKNSISLSKTVNQNFVGIPFYKLMNMLAYKCKRLGINFVLQEEAYTSKCDALAFESIEKHESYKGSRIKRGLFKSSVGKLINADINGALNILRKFLNSSKGTSEFSVLQKIMVAVWCSGLFGLPETVLKQSCGQYTVTTEPNFMQV